MQEHLRSPRVRIFVITHVPASFVTDSDGVYEPLHVGRDVMLEKSKDGDRPTANEISGCLILRGDNTGDHISLLNRYLNEMTGVYWAWKNYSSFSTDYVGFCHYRRYFIFDQSSPRPAKRWLPGSDYYRFDFIDPDVIHLAGIAPLYRLLSRCDILSPKKYDTKHLNPRNASCRDRFVEMGHDGELYDFMAAEVLKLNPSFEPEVSELGRSAAHYVGNMFVMRREDFARYCEFIFPILFRIAERVHEETDVCRRRAPAHLAECLTSMYISHATRTDPEIRHGELDLAYVLMTKPEMSSRAALVCMSRLAVSLCLANCLILATGGLLGRKASVTAARQFDEYGGCVRQPLLYKAMAMGRRGTRFLSRRIRKLVSSGSLIIV